MTSAAAEEPHVCNACAVGSFVNSFAEVTPETTEHLLAAAQELIAAARAVLDGLDRAIDHQREARGARPDGRRVRRIDIA